MAQRFENYISFYFGDFDTFYIRDLQNFVNGVFIQEVTVSDSVISRMILP